MFLQAAGHRNGPYSGTGGAVPELTAQTRERLQHTLLSWSIDLLSGPAGFPAYLRRHLLPARFTSLSQPLDLGRTTRIIPSHLRKAVIQRDKKCRFPGCEQPPSVCQVHHLIPWAQGRRDHAGEPGTFLQISPHHRHPPLGLENHLPPQRHHHRHRTRRTHPPLPRTTHRRRVSARDP